MPGLSVSTTLWDARTQGADDRLTFTFRDGFLLIHRPQQLQGQEQGTQTQPQALRTTPHASYLHRDFVTPRREHPRTPEKISCPAEMRLGGNPECRILLNLCGERLSWGQVSSGTDPAFPLRWFTPWCPRLVPALKGKLGNPVAQGRATNPADPATQGTSQGGREYMEHFSIFMGPRILPS